MESSEKYKLEISTDGNYLKYNENYALEIRMSDNYSFTLHYFLTFFPF